MRLINLMMKCQQELWTQLKRFFQAESLAALQALPKVLNVDECVTRFIFHRRDMSDGKAKFNPFMPENGTGTHETSTCRKMNITEERIWEIAKTVRLPKVAIARADIGVAVIHKSKLQVQAAPEPELNYPEHAVIVGWPMGEDVKAQHKEIAINLAAEAKVIKIPS